MAETPRDPRAAPPTIDWMFSTRTLAEVLETEAEQQSQAFELTAAEQASLETDRLFLERF